MNTIFFFGGGGGSKSLFITSDRTEGEISCHLQSITGGGGEGCRKLTAHANEGRRNRTLGGSGIFNWNKFLHCSNYSSIYSCIKKKSVSRGLFSTL